MFFLKKAMHPVAADYQAAQRAARPQKRMPASELRFSVLDIETTGFERSRDRILSISVVGVSCWTVAVGGLRSWLVCQPLVPLNEASAIHGITPAESAAGEPEERVMYELLQAVKGTVLVGHHIGFDIAMISEALQRHFRTDLRNPSVDTAELAMREIDAFHRTGYPNQRPPGLDEVCSLCGLPMLERHTAEGDAFTTAELFLLLCAKRRKRLGRELEWRDLPHTAG